MEDIDEVFDMMKERKIAKANSYNKTTTIETTNVNGILYHLVEFKYWTNLDRPYMFMERNYTLVVDGQFKKSYGMSRDDDNSYSLELYRADMNRLKKGKTIEH